MSSVPRLLVNNTGSDATGTDVYPQPGAPLEVWCWTERDEASLRTWRVNNNNDILPTVTEPTDEDVFILNAPGMEHIKILKFRSYNHSQAGRYICVINLRIMNSFKFVTLPIFIGENAGHTYYTLIKSIRMDDRTVHNVIYIILQITHPLLQAYPR